MFGLGSLIQNNESYICEYDPNNGTHDFYSLKKTLKKNFERVVSFKCNDKERFQYVCAYYDGETVDEEWIYSNMEKFSLSSSKTFDDFDDNKENISPNSISVSFSDKKINDMGKRKSQISLNGLELQEFLKVFFSTNDDLTMSSLNIDLENVIKPILISIEGNIGAGKSHLLSSMRKEHPEYCFIDEPVEFWESLRNEDNLSLLEVFYADQRRWSYTFQNCALLSRFKNIESTVNKKREEVMKSLKDHVLHGSSFKPVPVVFITERCLDTDKEVFAKLLFRSKQLDKLEYKLYETWYNLISDKATQLSAIIYVDTLPELCDERIKIRSRDGESSIPKEYLCALHEQQDSWIKAAKVPILRCTSDALKEVETFISTLM